MKSLTKYTNLERRRAEGIVRGSAEHMARSLAGPEAFGGTLPEMESIYLVICSGHPGIMYTFTL